MPNDPTTEDIPVGDIKLYDNYVPALDAGDWYIKVTHALTKDGAAVNTDALGALQEFVVSAPQFSLDPSEILSFYPPAGATGRFGETLPNVVLKEPLLPWERSMSGSNRRQPWLALLIFEQDELSAGDATAEPSPTRVFNTTVGDFLKHDRQGKLLKPAVHKADDVPADAPCAYIRVPTSVFRSIAPRLEELRYLAHCRQVNTGDKAVAGLNERGLFSVVVANRFPVVPASQEAPALLNVAHMVSLEGLETYLSDGASFGNYQEVALVSLASWTFQSLSDKPEDFRGLVTNMLYPGGSTAAQPYPPEHFWLRLPPATLDEAEPAQAQAARRMRDGFVPLGYHTRTGEDTFAWYRGPLTPLLTTPLQKGGPFMTADAAIIYQPAQGVFDFSLAAAWNIGRSVALADRSFGQTLFEMRRGAHRLTDRLYQRLRSDHFSQNDIATLDQNTMVQDEFLKVLDTQLIRNVGAAATTPVQSGGAAPAAVRIEGDDAPPDTDPKTAVENFLNDAGVQQRILELVRGDLEPVSRWLAQLLLLFPVPFDYLVADERMLPVESLRFFYLDNNWLDAMLDGALSVGTESSRDTFFNMVTRDLIRRSAYEAALTYRKNIAGVDPPAAQVQKNVTSGLLLRSGLVSGWPSLSVRPCLDGGQMLKTLRMAHLSPNVLLCVFRGVPDYVEISEPQEGFAFGTDEGGRVALRYPAGATIGGQLPGDPALSVRDPTGRQKLFMRSASSRVLDLSPDSPSGLVQGIKAGLEAQLKTTLEAFGPADIALQMVKVPEAVRLNCRTK
jgi:hypothetical protein